MWGLKLAKRSAISYLTLSSTMSKLRNAFIKEKISLLFTKRAWNWPNAPPLFISRYLQPCQNLEIFFDMPVIIWEIGDGNIYLCCLRRVREIGQMFHYLLCHASNILSSKITPKLVCTIVNKHYFTNYFTLHHSVTILMSLTFQFVSVCFSFMVGNGLLLIPRVSL